MTKKAYAIAEKLQRAHWDNCKVGFAKHTARAFAERALALWHDEHEIVSAYRKNLLYCHGIATDGGKNISPALTVHLAEKSLSEDAKTVAQRRARFFAKRDAEIEKIQRLSAAATAWFNAKDLESHTQNQRN